MVEFQGREIEWVGTRRVEEEMQDPFPESELITLHFYLELVKSLLGRMYLAASTPYPPPPYLPRDFETICHYLAMHDGHPNLPDPYQIFHGVRAFINSIHDNSVVKFVLRAYGARTVEDPEDFNITHEVNDAGVEELPGRFYINSDWVFGRVIAGVRLPEKPPILLASQLT